LEARRIIVGVCKSKYDMFVFLLILGRYLCKVL
jgi:hypothetical protein